MAVAQPLLSVFGENPELFAFLDARRRDALVFAVAIVVIPPLALFAVERASRLLGPRVAAITQAVLVGGLAHLFVIQLVSRPSPPVGALVIGLLAGVTIGVLYHRVAGVRTWTRLLAVVPVLALAGFVFSSPTADLFSSAAADPVAADEVLLVEEDEVPPVIYLMLDELPTRTLLGPDGTIDASRYPNFARLASESTWYRSHSTIANRTDQAAPSMLTGTEPREVVPLFTEHPDNLFRLLGDTHHLTVSESHTALCPPSRCGFHPIPPPATESASAGAPDEPATPDRTGFDAEPLYDRAVDVLLDRVLPGRDARGDQDDFEERLADVSTTTTTTTTTAPGVDTLAPGLGRPVDAEVQADDFWIRVRGVPDGQPVRFQEMVDLAYPTAEPTLYFLHLILPHFPWRYYPDGTQYGLPTDLPDFDADRSNPWITEVNRARHGFQTEHVDTLLGDLLAAFDEAGIYDDAVVVVASDHGVNFDVDVSDRDFEHGTTSDVVYAPLFIKEPGQREGRISDVNATVLDIVPTVAAAVGLRVPWETAGTDLADPAAADRSDTKRVWRFHGEFEPLSTDVFDYSQAALDEELLRPGLPPPRAAGDDPLAPLHAPLGSAADLIGRPFDPTGTDPSLTAAVDGRARFESPPAGEPPPAIVTGVVDGAVPDDAVAVVAVDGTVAALSPVVPFRGRDQAFIALLAPGALARGQEHHVDIGLYHESTGLVALAQP